MTGAVLVRGTRLGDRYSIRGLIARGGMGAVYDGLDERLDRPVAIKVLLRELVEDAEIVARFEREARVLARITHPSVAQVFDVGRGPDGHAFLVLERVHGETLSAVLGREGRLEPGRAVRLVIEALEGLAVVHAAGIVHRDLKPGNLMVTTDGGSERLKVLDFGVARLSESEAHARLTRTGAILGTPSFMAPEQAAGRSVDARTDLHAMGVVLYCLLVGKKPFEGRDPAEILEAIATRTPSRVSALVPEVPEAIASVVATALEKDPARRHVDADAMRAALSTALDLSGAQARVPRAATIAALPSPPSDQAIGAAREPRRELGARSTIAVIASLAGLLLGVLGLGLCMTTAGVGFLFGATTRSTESPSAPITAPYTPPPSWAPPPPQPPRPLCEQAYRCCVSRRTQRGEDTVTCNPLLISGQSDSLCQNMLDVHRRLLEGSGGETSACEPLQ